jgi:tRNA(Ile)-lysidine synthetase-like protein
MLTAIKKNPWALLCAFWALVISLFWFSMRVIWSGISKVVSEFTGAQLDFVCSPATEMINTPNVFTVVAVGEIFVRSRKAGDTIRLSGGTKSVKKLFIDRKIPAARRDSIPILCDDRGILGIPGISVNWDRVATELPATRIDFHL